MNTEKILHIIAGVAITLIVIGIAAGIVTMGSASVDKYTTEFDAAVTQVLETKYTKYDGSPTSGSLIINLIKTTYSSSNADPVYIFVKTTANPSGTYYVCDSGGIGCCLFEDIYYSQSLRNTLCLRLRRHQA